MEGTWELSLGDWGVGSSTLAAPTNKLLIKKGVCFSRKPRDSIRLRVGSNMEAKATVLFSYAATSARSVSANPRRYSAAMEARLHAVKNARLSAFNSSIQEAM